MIKVMRFMAVIILVGLFVSLFTGCEGSLKTLYAERAACLEAGCPDELHIEIDRIETARLKREEIKKAWADITYCPDGYFFCADFWCQDSRRRQMPDPRASMNSGCTSAWHRGL